MEVIDRLSCSFYCKYDRPAAEVFDAIINGAKLNAYFCTGPKPENLVPGTTVYWGFHDFPESGPFPVKVLSVEPNSRIHLQWESAVEGEWNDIHIEVAELENPKQSMVKITESGWPATAKGIHSCTESSGGWSNMLTCLKAYIEHGIVLRQLMF